jgi:hypothetical protein
MLGVGFSSWNLPLLAWGVQRLLRDIGPGIIVHTHRELERYVAPSSGLIRYPMMHNGMKRSGGILPGWESIAEITEALDSGHWTLDTTTAGRVGYMQAERLAKGRARSEGESRRVQHPRNDQGVTAPELIAELVA